jgi:hypothetical protein
MRFMSARSYRWALLSLTHQTKLVRNDIEDTWPMALFTARRPRFIDAAGWLYEYRLGTVALSCA